MEPETAAGNHSEDLLETKSTAASPSNLPPIYLHGDDLFGVLEVDDFDRFRTAMDAGPVNARWQAEMTALIDPGLDPATGFHRRLDEVFRLD